MYTGDNWNTPVGMRDWLPPEAGEKRELINNLLQNMSYWGYQEISSPLLEYYAILTRGENGAAGDNLYKLIERDGSILALRPEMTTPIARIIGNKIQGGPPWRLMYGGEVFRYEPVQAGRQREFSQVGVELVGERGAHADCEALALAIDSLRSIGLDDFTVSLGHMGVLNGLLESLSWEEQILREVRRLILEKDFAGLHHLLERAGLAFGKREELVNLLTRPLFLKDLDTLMPQLPPAIHPAINEVREIIKLLGIYGYEPYIQVDLSTLRSQTYYTGMVFEIYTKGLGYPIGGGGRYDQLLCKFGRDYPSTGFALGVERLMLSLIRKKKRERPFYLVAEPGGKFDGRSLIEKAEKLRAEGKPVILEMRELTAEEAEQQAAKIGAQLLNWPEVKKNGI